MIQAKRYCPALVIGAPASGEGKTAVTAALARMHRNLKRRVRIFKCGPDFLDPMILERASGKSVYQLDLWIQGENECRRLLWEAAESAELILVEGVMGLFDGTPCSADLSALFNIPVLAVIDAGAMAQTFAAIAFGLAHYRPGLPFAGVFANKTGSRHHIQILRSSLDRTCPGGASEAFAGTARRLPWFGSLPRSAGLALPSRHLGLLQADEIDDLDLRLDKAAKALMEEAASTELPPAVEFLRPAEYGGVPPSPSLRGLRIGIARDAAFSFIYQANLDLLAKLGATPVFFSPLNDAAPPDVDSLYFPGGYPELYLQALHDNSAMLRAIRRHHESGKPILAECGGMLYLLEALTNQAGLELPMAGILPGKAEMRKKPAALGSQEVELPEGKMRGHTFHYSELSGAPAPVSFGKYPAKNRRGEAVYRCGSLTASYIHLYFPSNPLAVSRLFTGRP
jgi:cobyrinic acid a,c-diamide synthase